MIRTTSNIKQFNASMAKRAKALPKALDRGLSKWVMLAHKEAHRLLSGSGSDGAGAYPVPVRTGQLRRAESYILPGRSKHGIQARQGEAYLVNTALYATNIHEDRPFMQDGIENTRKAGMEAVVQSIRTVLMDNKMRGLKL